MPSLLQSASTSMVLFSSSFLLFVQVFIFSSRIFRWCTVLYKYCPFDTVFFPLLTSICLFFCAVWPNRGDRQHPEPRLCQKVHLGLLFRGKAKPSLWLVSDFTSGLRLPSVFLSIFFLSVLIIRMDSRDTSTCLETTCMHLCQGDFSPGVRTER